MSEVKNSAMISLHLSQLSHSTWSEMTLSMARITSLARGSAWTTVWPTRKEKMRNRLNILAENNSSDCNH